MTATVSSLSGPSAARVVLPLLPIGLEVEKVYSDFLKYLWTNAKQWYEDNNPEYVLFFATRPSAADHFV